ncbi:MAG: helix-turn-helix transcriptional regulator [Clostridia bacterium]|jgi:ribosome-binding protein aMBF1 (putative translation factor)|nr:helix-turn-helix transcriptional regulator [Clostridia bacterium]MBR4767118.1 helix-turn-helix transcriptional regulator [Clostridia bacterium]MBR6941333.1 helix-turn-helix transcriptional regulator [Clostridia bacterium]
MRTWEDYKNHVKGTDELSKKEIEEIEALASIVSAIIDKRNEMGLSQRDLAELCGIPQSSVARIETFKTTPNVETLIKLLQPLGLKLTVSVA